MLDALTEQEAGLLLEFQQASYENVFPSLRLVSGVIDERPHRLFFFHDGPICEDDLESINLMVTYFGVHYSDGLIDTQWTHTRIDYPAPIPNVQGECFYARKEKTPLVRQKRGILISRGMNRWTKVGVAVQRAMCTNIFPQIRKISAAYDDTKATIHVFVDGNICDDDKRSLERMQQYFSEQFPKEEMVHCGLSVERIDFPKPMPGFDVCSYIRKEISNYK